MEKEWSDRLTGSYLLFLIIDKLQLIAGYEYEALQMAQLEAEDALGTIVK